MVKILKSNLQSFVVVLTLLFISFHISLVIYININITQIKEYQSTETLKMKWK
jgi:hypothetical protein